MPKYKLDLDEIMDNLFTELERLSEGKHGHECVVNAKDSNIAAMQLARSLVPFFEKYMREEQEKTNA